MPLYLYLCPDCHADFEARGLPDDRFWECPRCGSPAERRPYSGVPYLKGETVAKSIPDPLYRQDAEHRELKKEGWDLDRSVRHIRKGMKETSEGFKVFDPKQADTAIR